MTKAQSSPLTPTTDLTGSIPAYLPFLVPQYYFILYWWDTELKHLMHLVKILWLQYINHVCKHIYQLHDLLNIMSEL
jgi:hypothetical protein